MIEAKLRDACGVVIDQVGMLYEQLWKLLTDRAASRWHIIGGL